MPLPSPNTGEPQDDFMARCMGNDAVTTEYPDQDQRTAICLRQFVGEATDGKADDQDVTAKSIGPLEVKDEAKGLVEAIVGTIGEVDRQGDVFLPGCVGNGVTVKLSGYGHSAIFESASPAGRGTVTEENGKLKLSGRFYMTTERGKEAFLTVKEEGEEGEWSVTFLNSSATTAKMSDEWRTKGARRLVAKAPLIEASPVFRGAQFGTGTLAVKHAVKEAVKEADEEVARAKAEEESAAARKLEEEAAAQKATEEKAEAERLEAEKKAAEELEAKRLADEAETKRLADEVEAKRIEEEVTAKARREVDREEYERVQRSLKRMGLR